MSPTEQNIKPVSNTRTTVTPKEEASFFTNSHFVHPSDFCKLDDSIKNHSNNNLKDLIIFLVDFNVENYTRPLFEQFDVEFPSSLASAVNKRQAEFLAGRVAASKVLSRLSSNTLNVPIGSERQPIWPKNILGSITHTKSTALCIASYNSNFQYLGIDLEIWINIKTIEEIRRSIILSDEDKLLTQSTLDYEKAFTLAFSAKESLFKALYPKVNAFFDFSAAEIINLSIETRSFVIQLKETLGVDLNKGRRFMGNYNIYNDSVFTLIAET